MKVWARKAKFILGRVASVERAEKIGRKNLGSRHLEPMRQFVGTSVRNRGAKIFRRRGRNLYGEILSPRDQTIG